jgi:hypothetical protein
MRTFANMMVLWCIPIIGQHLDGMATRIHRIQKLIDKIIETGEKHAPRKLKDGAQPSDWK